MDFETLQKEWNAFTCEPKTHDEWRSMMYASPAWGFRGASLRSWLNFFMKLTVLLVIAVGFDLFGSWSTGICAGWGLYIFLDDYLGIRYLHSPPHQDGILESLLYMKERVQRAWLVSRLAHILLWLTVVVVFGQTVPLANQNTFVWALLFSPALAAIYWWNSRRWTGRLQEVVDLLNEFTDNQPEPVSDKL
jgi:hypothetical protein